MAAAAGAPHEAGDGDAAGLGTELLVLGQELGFDIGGPIYFLKFGEGGGSPIWNGKDKAFFFFSYEGFRENFSVTRNRTVLTPEARQGIFRYTVGGVQQSVNLLQIGNVNTLNPITMAFINSTPAPNNTEVGDGLNTAGYRFNVSGKDNNDKYVFRYDHQLVKDGRFGGHKLEFVYNRSDFVLSPDTFNGLEATFPGGAVNNFQGSARTLFTGALHSTFGSNFSNVFRYGRQFAPIGFLADGTPSFGDLVVYRAAPALDRRRTRHRCPFHRRLNPSTLPRVPPPLRARRGPASAAR